MTEITPIQPSPLVAEQQKKREFLKALEEHCCVITRACEAAGVPYSTVRKWRMSAEDPEFAERYAEITSGRNEMFEDIARRRALIGNERRIYYKGALADTYYEPSDDMLKFILRAEMPEKYGKEAQVQVNIASMTDDAIDIELQALRARIEAQEAVGDTTDAEPLPPLEDKDADPS